MNKKVVIFDWGDTVMRDFAGFPGHNGGLAEGRNNRRY